MMVYADFTDDQTPKFSKNSGIIKMDSEKFPLKNCTRIDKILTQEGQNA